jgi:hypothetical protein
MMPAPLQDAGRRFGRSRTTQPHHRADDATVPLYFLLQYLRIWKDKEEISSSDFHSRRVFGENFTIDAAVLRTVFDRIAEPFRDTGKVG